MNDEICIRRATLKDLKALIKYRIDLFQEMGHINDLPTEKAFKKTLERYFTEAISKNEFISWVAEFNSNIIASSGLVILKKPPTPKNPSGREAYIMNMYTKPQWRRRGIATMLLEEIFSFLQDIKIKKMSLHATEIGKGVYEKMGFQSLHITEIEMIRQKDFLNC
ncbi:MAG: GNAT family N-acetyltransferase [Candidatus Hodarchaeota archaeon]